MVLGVRAAGFPTERKPVCNQIFGVCRRYSAPRVQIASVEAIQQQASNDPYQSYDSKDQWVKHSIAPGPGEGSGV